MTNPEANFGCTQDSPPVGWAAILGRGVLLLISLYAGWDTLVVLDMNYHLFWIVSRPHYEIAFTIETPDGVQTAKSIIEPVYFSAHAWDELLPPLPEIGPGPPAFGRMLNGEAAAMRLPDGKVICMMFQRQLPHNGTAPNSVFEIADKLLTFDDKISFPQSGRKPFIDSYTAMKISGSAEIPLDIMPSMLVFLNGADMRSAHLFDPKKPEQWLGAGAKFIGARISVTTAPILSDPNLKMSLPWLQGPRPHGRQPRDPFTQEARSADYPDVLWDLLLYRSRI